MSTQSSKAPNSHGTALITGASSGIGAIYADRLAHAGYDLILVARDAARLNALATSLRAATGRTIDVAPADLTDQAALRAIAQILEIDPAITVLINNAGISLNGGLLQTGPDALQTLIAINITAPTILAAAAAKAFVSRKSGDRRAIVNISSVLALAPELLEGAYSGSKAYLLNLSLKLAADLKEFGVHVQAVLPGATRTEIWQRSGKDADAMMPGLVMDAGDLVDAALLGLDRGETVTIPPLEDLGLWTTYEEARLALAPYLSRAQVAERYRTRLAA